MLSCGLLGEHLSHSYSPAIHKKLGDYIYRLWEVPPHELEGFLRQGKFDALNVTIPYKRAVMPFCRELSDTARAIGSVNTLLRREDGTLFGDNTDAEGFRYLLRSSGTEVGGKKALVFGSGGASLTAQYVLRSLGAEVTVISRRGRENYDTLERHTDAEVLVNATPLGMYPMNGEACCDPGRFPRCASVIDMVYNPRRTALLLRAEALGIPAVGRLPMLVAQAKRAAELFTGAAIPDRVMAPILRELERKTENIILIGMPGSGKTAIGRALAEALGRPFLDADGELVREAGRSIPEIFAAEGEAGFRARETRVLAELGKLSSSVIATGGGAVTREENYPLLHQNGTIFRLLRDTDKLAREGRPLSRPGSLQAMAEEREPMYARFADMNIDNNGTPEETLARFREVLT